MRYEILVALNVTDDRLYQNYRNKMMPILESYEGGFGYDFKISEVLKKEEEKPINRVFTIYFGSRDLMQSFFTDEKYLKVKQAYFENSVSSTTIISEYVRD